MTQNYPNQEVGSMWYMDALHLIDLSIEYGLLKVVDFGIAVYMVDLPDQEDGWYLFTKEQLAHRLKDDVEGQSALIDHLAALDVVYERTYEHSGH